jgi:hypothetical protein
MSLFGRMIAELETPDEQGRDWYGWASNQMSHALLGVIVALYFPAAPLEMAAIVALLKETGDLYRGGKFRDSLADVSFWVLGAWLVTAQDHNLALIALAIALVCGVIPRARKAAKDSNLKGTLLGTILFL